jgi:hypothetical protein
LVRLQAKLTIDEDEVQFTAEASGRHVHEAGNKPPADVSLGGFAQAFPRPGGKNG